MAVQVVARMAAAAAAVSMAEEQTALAAMPDREAVQYLNPLWFWVETVV